MAGDKQTMNMKNRQGVQQHIIPGKSPDLF